MPEPHFKLHDFVRKHETTQADRRRSAAQRVDFDSTGGDDGGMTAWQSSMENRLGSFDRRLEDLRKVIDRDFRWTWGGMVAFAAAAVAGYFALADKMNSQFLTLLDKIN